MKNFNPTPRPRQGPYSLKSSLMTAFKEVLARENGEEVKDPSLSPVESEDPVVQKIEEVIKKEEEDPEFKKHVEDARKRFED